MSSTASLEDSDQNAVKRRIKSYSELSQVQILTLAIGPLGFPIFARCPSLFSRSILFLNVIFFLDFGIGFADLSNVGGTGIEQDRLGVFRVLFQLGQGFGKKY